MKIVLEDFNAKVVKEGIFKPTIGYESLHEDSNVNDTKVVNFATGRNLIKSRVYFLNIKTYISELKFLRTAVHVMKLIMFFWINGVIQTFLMLDYAKKQIAIRIIFLVIAKLRERLSTIKTGGLSTGKLNV